MADLGKIGRRRRADLARGAVGADQVREFRLDRRIFAHQRVIGGVRNLRRVVGMVEARMVGDLAGEALQRGGGFGFGHRGPIAIVVVRETIDIMPPPAALPPARAPRR
ncbi:hypothetical protein GCM10023232_18420 [Sphingosinicella ginsenosidimutans]